MKKVIVILLALFISLCFFACSKNETSDNDTDAQISQTTDDSTVIIPEVSTTKAPTEDTARAKKLSNTVVVALKEDNDDKVIVNDDGSFEYKILDENSDQSVLYSLEYSDKLEERSYNNIDSFVDGIRDSYPDGKDIKLYQKNTQQVGTGDNGIDSAVYTASYINTQNQLLVVYADSTGCIYYAKCDFTW